MLYLSAGCIVPSRRRFGRAREVREMYCWPAAVVARALLSIIVIMALVLFLPWTKRCLMKEWGLRLACGRHSECERTLFGGLYVRRGGLLGIIHWAVGVVCQAQHALSLISFARSLTESATRVCLPQVHRK